MHKGTPIISEIVSFFSEKRQSDLISSLSSVVDSLRFGNGVFGEPKHHNCKVTYLQALQILLLLPFFKVKGFSHYSKSVLYKCFDCEKDTLYSFMAQDNIDWRDILYRFSIKLKERIKVRQDYKQKNLPNVLIVDDTDLPKTGMHIEKIGKIFSHIDHKCILGFKSLNMCWSDGTSLLPLDFSLHGEKGKIEGKEQGLTQKQRERRKVYNRDKDSHISLREEEYMKPKGEMLIEMVKRAIKHKVEFDYLLVDSWFTNTSLVDFVCNCHKKFNLLGMGKLSKTKYKTDFGELNAAALIKKFDRPKTRKTSRLLRCQYFSVNAKLGGRKVKLFFCRMGKNERWRLLVTTDLNLDFVRAYQIYSMRWSIEVFYSDCKKHLNLARCSSTNFSHQIAHVAIASMQYGIMSYVKRTYDYSTIGGLFHSTYLGIEDLTVADKIWDAVLNVVSIISTILHVSEDELIGKIIESDNNFRLFSELAKSA